MTASLAQSATLVSWWPAENNANDAGPSGNNGSTPNGISYVSGFDGQAFSFSGQQYVTINDNGNLDSSSLTIDGLFKFSQAPSGPLYSNNEYILINKYNGGNINGWILRMGNDLKPAFGIYRDAPHHSEFISSGDIGALVPIPLNSWVRITVTFDGTTATIFINGHFAGNGTLTGGYQPANSPLVIGGPSWSSGTRYMNGVADNVKIYNGALTATEIQNDIAPPDVISINTASDIDAKRTALIQYVWGVTNLPTRTDALHAMSRRGGRGRKPCRGLRPASTAP